MSKPIKNRIMCPECGRAKMLFEAESKAKNFIKFKKIKSYFNFQSYWAMVRTHYIRFDIGCLDIVFKFFIYKEVI